MDTGQEDDYSPQYMNGIGSSSAMNDGSKVVNGIRASGVQSEAPVREKGDWDELFMDCSKRKLLERPETSSSGKAKHRRNASAATL
ncbi:hypothetical protein LTR56_002022 [Elasticomyces elasticus]|nr:hypothetical protein LTR22_022263 [Elasticomyces elasticus]KAK3658165.1 hypothetical protein LTR56_002022 [Elasticomyces elasticus]KAK4907275.1 hypothetical protein LTR49_023688 [Elasticomyces elasticus]KAK5764050.1 hypothetical protein LTS12_005744 [Elasticomyces elasticus]